MSIHSIESRLNPCPAKQIKISQPILICIQFNYIENSVVPDQSVSSGYTVQSLYNTIPGVHRNEQCYKGIIYKENYTKMNMSIISINFFVEKKKKKKKIELY